MGGGKKEAEFLQWKIMRLDLDDEVRKPSLDSQVEIEAIVGWRIL